jgi:hypothetical protein
MPYQKQVSNNFKKKRDLSVNSVYLKQKMLLGMLLRAVLLHL